MAKYSLSKPHTHVKSYRIKTSKNPHSRLKRNRPVKVTVYYRPTIQEMLKGGLSR